MSNSSIFSHTDASIPAAATAQSIDKGAHLESSNAPALQIQNLSCHYEQTQVLHQLDLKVKQGEIVCLLGASGCGKTTLLKAIAGLLPLSSGQIVLNGKKLDDAHSQTAPEHRNMGLIFQDYALFPHLTVAQNIAFGLKGIRKQAQQEQVQNMLELVQLEGLEQRYPHELSGGQQQRVAIARSLAYQPDLLLLDEPFSNIDTQVRQNLIADIRAIFKKQGVTAIFVTHSREEAFAFSDSMAVMNHGVIEQFGSASHLYYQPASPFVANFLGGGSYVDGQVIAPNQVQTSLGKLTCQTRDFAISDQVKVLIRPQNIMIEASSQGRFQVEEVQFMGDHCRYVVRGEGESLTAVSQSPLGRGDKVMLNIQATDLVLFAH
ncbi:MAG: ABC transporter ATP-binding protein [Vibrio sp.]